MKRKLGSALPYLLILAVGGVTVTATDTMVAYIPAWIWQIVVGFAVFIGGFALFLSVPTGGKTILQRLRTHPGWIFAFVGVTVFFNFNRYGDIVAANGNWPVIVVGAMAIYAGLVMLVLVFLGRPKPEYA